MERPWNGPASTQYGTILQTEEERPVHIIDHITYKPEQVKAINGGIVELETPLYPAPGESGFYGQMDNLVIPSFK